MIEDVLMVFFGIAALAGGLLMLAARRPMRAAMALAGTMLALAALYAILGLHVVAVFQVLIYVGAVMVFLVYAIMLVDEETGGAAPRRGPALAAAGTLVALGAIVTAAVLRGAPAGPAPGGPFGVQDFARAFLRDHWLYFELASVLLVAAVVAAIAVLRARGREDG